MAGHSKWANIKHRKGAVDKKRGVMFARSVKELMVAAKMGGSDASSNPRLRIAMSKARAVNMPRDTIERAVKKGAGELDGQTFDEVRYEIYAPGGVGLIVDALTDKKSRTTPEVKSLVNKHGGNLANENAVSRNFERKGHIVIAADAIGEDELMELVLEAGAEDLSKHGDMYEVLTAPEDFGDVLEAISAKEIESQEAEVKFLAIEGTEVEVASVEKAQKLLHFIDLFEEHDDVQAVFHNMHVSDEIMEQL